MPTEAQIASALVKADAAGDAAGAKILANALKQMRATPVPTAPVGSSPTGAVAGAVAGATQPLIDTAAGAVRGAASIGNTLLSIPDKLLGGVTGINWDENRQSATNALASMGADPNSLPFQGAKFGTEIAGTLGIPGGPAARVAPEGLNILARTGFALKDIVPRVAAGAAQGAGMAGLIDPSNVAAGAGVGAALPPAIQFIAKPVIQKIGAPAFNWFARFVLGQVAPDRAANLIQQAADNPETRQAVIAAWQQAEASGLPQNAAQGAAPVNAPMLQALLDDALKSRTAVTPNENLLAAQDEASQNALSRLAGGATAADQRFAQKTGKDLTNQTLGPVRETVLNAANEGRNIAPLEAQAARMGDAASNKVTDVGRFTAAGERATEGAAVAGAEANAVALYGREAAAKHLGVSPLAFDQWSRLSGQSEMRAQDAADASLLFGEARRHAQMVADSIRAHGMKPLDVEPILSRLRGLRSTPAYQANQHLQAVLDKVTQVIEQGAKDGPIDSFLLDAIRKDTVNTAIESLLGSTLKSSAQKGLAAKVMTDLKPSIIGAIDKAAGGEGAYGKYLKAYSAEMQKLAEKKLGGKALELWNSDKDAFVKLVQGTRKKDIDAVEKILGPGQYDIARDVSENFIATLRAQADMALRNASAAKQASGGQRALAQLLREELPRFSLPGFLNRWIFAANKSLSTVEQALDRKTMQALATAARSPKGVRTLMERLPAAERSKLLQLVNNPSTWTRASSGATRVGVNALAEESP